MLQPHEMTLNLPVEIPHGVMSTTTKVWEILVASKHGDLQKVQQIADECPALLYAQYNYTPPIHFAVREGHVTLVEYLLQQGALDPTYRIYPFSDNLLTIAQDREYHTIAAMLTQYLQHPGQARFTGDNGKIDYQRTVLQQDFENAVDKGDPGTVRQLLLRQPGMVHDLTFFWGEGILMMPAKDNNLPMVELLLQYGATVPVTSKWGQFYYFKHYEMAAYLMTHGMSAQHISWQQVTLLHDIAQQGELQKAMLLVKHGANLHAIDDEYQSTPLGMAARWGHLEMVDYLLQQGADPNLAGAEWATPLVWAQKKGHPAIENLLCRAGAR